MVPRSVSRRPAAEGVAVTLGSMLLSGEAAAGNGLSYGEGIVVVVSGGAVVVVGQDSVLRSMIRVAPL